MTPQEQLCEKMRVEQSAYCLWLTAQPPEEILHHAYEYSVREDIILATEEMNLTLAQVRALLKSPAPLADVYKDFSKLETDYMSIVAQCVEDRADDLLKKEQQQNPPKVYRQSVTYAREHGELQQYHASCHLNERCRDEIDAALAQRFDGLRLGAGAVEQVVTEYGLERTKYVLAAAIQTRDGTYLVVETTVPHDLFQAEPFIVTVDPEQDNNPWGAMATPKDSVMTGSDSYQKFTVLDEEIEVYLRITKVDEETGKPVLLPDTAFQIYWLDEQGHYRYDSNGNPKLVTMTDTVNGHLTKDVTTFYTNGEGILTLPEKLPLGKYRIVEVTGPNRFYNEWLDSAGYENGVLADDADGSYYVDFEITTDRIYAATGDKNENGMDTPVSYTHLTLPTTPYV
mgnify:CR=1 FL=1